MMKLLRAHGQARGSTLLEVALAVAIMAASGVGLIATQLSLSRHAQTAAVRAQAVFIADALAEAAVEGSSGIGAGDQWGTRASVVIPGGAVSIASAGIDASVATVTWPAKPYGSAAAPQPCAGAPASPGRECASLTFAR
ncbi:type IV pilus modification PilV family protein [Paraburkholderia caballeronis]|uniref:type IV pilus modification PilV family protein n=1 Tax=Paraburkholderia caballeronis TaxID=416943 RepID=UPI0010656453|nr:hypothetical protein [Paraburkholderia caballeronis]